MSDIFQEVEEDVRRERFEKLWKQYGDYVIAGVALLIIAIAGYELWTRYEDNQRLKASETMIAAQQLAESDNAGRANPAFAVIAKDAPGGYAEMAKLAEAGTLAGSGHPDEAVQIYKSVAASDDGPIGRAALVRAAWASADTASKADLQTLLGSLAADGSPWRHAAREVLAYADFRAGDQKAAQAEFQALADDKDAPDLMRRRTAAMAAFLKEGGMASFGTVPLPAPAAPPPGAPAGAAPPSAATPPAPTGKPNP